MRRTPVLDRAALARATAFLHAADPLDRATFAFHFESGSPLAVRDALRRHQNADGGFSGLEPDLGIVESSALCTCQALHLLAELGVPASDPDVQRALDFLVATFDDTTATWPIIPRHDNSRPRAPWWDSSEKLAGNFGHYRDNPRPDVLACLLHFADPKTATIRARAAASLTEWVRDHAEGIDMHGLVCHVRLHAAPNVPPDLARELAARLPDVIRRVVQTDPAKWDSYVLRPLDVAPLAGSPWQAQLGPSIDDHLDYLIRTQGADGTWGPAWSWFGAYPESWPAAQRRWTAQLTTRALRSLRSYGRMA